MSLVCSICESKATYRISIDCGRFKHIFYYCKIHTPKGFKLQEMGKKQKSDGKVIREEKFVKGVQDD